MIQEHIHAIAESVRETTPLVHCITNYVTVESCANALLAVGGSPIMSDEVEDVTEITSICNALVLNIGTLNKHTIAGMHAAGKRATELEHPIVLDPVGAGASMLRTQTACELLDTLAIKVIRGNMSEVKALVGGAGTTKGVDVDPGDIITDETLPTAGAFARDVARKTGTVVAITGPIDVIADSERVFALRNGSPFQGRITGCGCMLSALTGAYAARAGEHMLEAVVAAVAHMSIAGQIAEGRLTGLDGNGSFHTYLMDALSTLTPDELVERLLIEEVEL